jgi:hypothetical protein
MGANAQTTVPTFTAGQILTADQQNQSARTGVPVFATTVTRDAAFGGTGEKTLAEGQLAYVEGTGLQSYNGTSWITWGAAPSSGALTLISATTIGSAVTSVTVSSAFSSTYDNYLVTVSGGVASTNIDLIMELGATTTNYTRTGFFVTLGSATLTGFTGTDWRIGHGSTDNLMGNVTVFSPNLTKRTTGVANFVTPATSQAAQTSFLLLNDTTAYTAFTIKTNSGTITGGTIRVYGYANS